MTEQTPRVGDMVRMHDGSHAHITEVRKDVIQIRGDGIIGFQPIIIDADMLHKVIYKPTPISKVSFYWQVIA